MEKLNSHDFQLINTCIQQIYSLRTLAEFPKWIMMLLEDLIISEESFCCSFTTQVNMMAGTMVNTWADIATPEYLRDNPALQNYLKTGSPEPNKISNFISDRDFLNREGLYETLFLHYRMRDQLGFMVSDSRRDDGLIADFEEVLCDRLKSLVDGSLPVEERPLLSAIVADPTTFYQNETLGHLSIGFHRSNRSFTDRDLSILAILLPHLKIAYRNSQQYTKFQRQLQQQSQVFDRLKAIVLTVSGDVSLISASIGNLLAYYFDGEWINSNQLPDILNSWVKQQLKVQQADLIVPIQPWQIEKNGRKLKIDLLCDFAAEQHLLICSEQSVDFSPIPHFESIGLSKREAAVLALVAAGKANLQIAEQLTISIKTVKKHLEHIFSKLNATSRIDAVNKALQQLDRSVR
ncbi:helix-turn-helix transcriptional regulator [Chamaesiphon sp. VAR_48_metabat_135_sub]|uniref:helix-turn-helix domain-containing protein n=1 Tax=Chamaesiphon sp. VAR_48_metabat_135_sub TaxID=2964699 RepID=UPI00286AA1AB|nr:helix-turn-helix transcriptional regulator [Chamaesiphon sp. VAR_48_metabat_135_sub]